MADMSMAIPAGIGGGAGASTGTCTGLKSTGGISSSAPNGSALPAGLSEDTFTPSSPSSSPGKADSPD